MHWIVMEPLIRVEVPLWTTYYQTPPLRIQPPGRVPALMTPLDHVLQHQAHFPHPLFQLGRLTRFS